MEPVGVFIGNIFLRSTLRRRSVIGIDPGRDRGFLDQPLPQIGDVRAAGAAIGRRRRRIGEDQPMPAVHRRDIVEADGRAGRRRNRVDERARVGAIRAEIDQPLDSQREKLPLAVERQLADQVRRPAMMVAGHRLRARAEPPHRLAGPLGRQHDREKFRIDLVAHAEAAADVGGADAEFLRWKSGDLRQRRFQIAGPLGRDANLERFIRGVIERDAGFRLHRIAGNPLRVQLDANDMGRLGKSRLGGLPVAVLVVERQIVGQFVMHTDGAFGDGIARRDQRRQIFVFDRDELGGVLSDVFRLRDDQRHRLADIADALMREPGRNGTRSELPPTPLKNAIAGAPFQPVAMRSAPVRMSRTPGSFRAAAVSIRAILACARSARRKWPATCPSKP